MLSYSPVEKSKSSSLNLLCFACIAFFVFVPDLAYCAGLGSAEKLLTKVSEWLKYLAVATVTVAILVVGYKVIFGGQTIPECSRIIIGAILIASASTIASILLG
ncbi:TrbC/VirB2 family protein [Campylobacter concisus]|uniref:TrbC/VirB2 family protein n=1 Tax=Campylobacter concisus TaxID=199 RepID=UPI000CD9AC37|nr:TrbC/VirB2 family protein [Campylobacter concisus]